SIIFLFSNNSSIYIIFISRLFIFFKYLGLLSILGASLFTFTIKKQKIGNWILLSVLTSIVMAYFVHFNTGVIEKNLIPQIIFYKEENVITISIISLLFITFIKSGFDAKNREYFYMGIASLWICLGFVLSLILSSFISGVIIIILFIFGSALYLKSMHNITLWS
ncbi:MAG: hypothetical protein JXR64_08590, partial [Spirochaetales bacterium]|nr:hypothetical protein [Spirochaetales bacterium]